MATTDDDERAREIAEVMALTGAPWHLAAEAVASTRLDRDAEGAHTRRPRTDAERAQVADEAVRDAR